MAAEKVHVHLEIVAEFGFGEDLYVVGPHTCLGSNNVQHALQLHLMLGSTGTLVWKNQSPITLARKADTMKFKLLRFSAGEMADEEPDVGQRSVSLSEEEGGHLFLKLAWGEKADKGSFGKMPTVSSFSNLEHFMDDEDHGASSVMTAPVITSKERVILVMHQLPVIVQQNPDTQEWEVQWDDENFLSKTHIDKHVRSNFLPQVNSQTFKFGRQTSDSTAAPPMAAAASTDSDGGDDEEDSELPHLHWFGVVPSPTPIPKRERRKIAEILKDFNCTPMWLDPKDLENYDTRYTKQTLWPIFHQQMDIFGDVPTRWWDGFGLEESWNSYVNVNLKFASEVKQMVSADSNCIVWVHGLHLLLFPLFLKRRLRTVNVGLFLHNPFPSSEIFRSLSVRTKILRAMLNADHIGFHLYEYARHFITGCCRILNLSSETKKGGHLAIKADGREVLITCSHVGMDGDFIKSRLAHANVPKTIEQLKTKFEGKIVLVGVDGLERLKGLPLKFHAYKRFLEKNPNLVDKVVLFQLGIPDVARGGDYERTREEVANIIAEIEAKFPGSVEYVLSPFPCPFASLICSHFRLFVAGFVFVVRWRRYAFVGC
jgi:trehalose 6-phosphate synthase/phosphatase